MRCIRLGIVATLGLAVLAQAGVVGSIGQKKLAGAQHTLKLKPVSAPIRFHVKRSWRADPVTSGNGSMDHSFDVTVSSPSVTAYRLAISGFRGVDLRQQEDSHMGRMAPAVNKLAFTRSSDTLGPTSHLRLAYANTAGWVGIMVAKAVGLYEVGFLGVKFPAKAVRIGERWKVPFVLAQDSRQPTSDLYQKITVKQTGGDIVFTLEAVTTESKLRIARIGYVSKGQATISVISKALGDGMSIEDVTEQGTIWIDLATGWPIRAKLSRVVTTRWDGQTSVEKSTTDVKRVTK